MIFRVYDHYNIYDYHIENYDNTNSECLICYEFIDENNTYPIFINYEQKIFTKDCFCKLNTHITCLNKWIQFKNICPICRKCIIRNNLLMKKNFVINIFIHINQNKFIFFRFVIFLYTIYYLLNNFLIICMIRLILAYCKLIFGKAQDPNFDF